MNNNTSKWNHIISSIKVNGMFYTLKKLFGEIIYYIVYPILLIYWKNLKINDSFVLFASRPDYSDNALYFSDYIYSNKPHKYHIIWLVEEPSKYNKIHNDIEFIKWSSSWHTGSTIKAIKAVYQSRFIFFTHGSPMSGMVKKDKQVIINLWHGCGYKDIKSTDNWIGKNPFDYALVPGSVFVETKSHFWNCKKDQILPIGYPRYDEFNDISKNTYDMFRLLRNNANKVIIWMPTYRKTERNQYAVSKIKGFYELPIVRSIEELKELDDFCLSKNVRIIIKRHHYQVDYKSSHIKLNNIIFVDDVSFKESGASLYGFLACVDALITDYSSVAIDFLLLDKPIGFTLDDFDAYKDTQGFVFENPLEYMPGSHIYNYKELCSFIEDISIDRDNHRDIRHALMSKVHNPCENYCERICKKIFEEGLE